MAALINHVLSKIKRNLFILNPQNTQYRNYVKKHFKEQWRVNVTPKPRTLKSTQDSIGARGFLRAVKPYEPPEDVEIRLKQLFGPIENLNDPIKVSTRYELFNECYKAFNHGIPNSLLHTIKTYNDLFTFYLEPVDTTLPLDRLKMMPLPPNLHVQTEALRFHPETDQLFNGQTAFPKSNTLVSGLKTRRKYKGYQVIDSWPGQ